ncbi:MAG: indolepyruvate ferredoxin oxidoreductase subunit alpha [Anaerolineae bacterium]
MKRLLPGNEAIALGAYLGGATVATGYPGTPSTEIVEAFCRYPGVYAEWSVNEKVALEVGVGAALVGARTIVTMKHVGLNVAADPFFAVAYTGIKGGLVVVSADDPGMHSSQGEQDNRNYARFAKVPLLEPSDSQECLDMTRLALDLSEEFDTPVLLRPTGRISHAQSLVEVEADAEAVHLANRGSAIGFDRDAVKYVMLPGNARKRRVVLEERLQRLRQYAESSPLNHVVWGDRSLGVVSSSIAYQYAREVFPSASHLKLGMAYPLPVRTILDFARQVGTLLIIEELDPFLEEQIRGLPDMPRIRILGKEVIPAYDELSAEVVARAAAAHGLIESADAICPPPSPALEPSSVALPPRPPVLCPGCPHRAAFYVLRRLTFPVPDGEGGSKRERVVVTGDIGCYTLGALQPLAAMDTCSCMGASIGTAIGMEKAGVATKVVAVIGDSTFYHSGITGLVNVITSGAATTVVILDNSITAMTGGNPNAGTGATVAGQPARRVDLETLCRGLGIEDVQVIGAYDADAIEKQLRRSLQSSDPTVLIVRAPCCLQDRSPRPYVSLVDADKCTGCGACLRTGCPALVKVDDKVEILANLCTGCQVCNQVCRQEAISLVDREEVRR